MTDINTAARLTITLDDVGGDADALWRAFAAGAAAPAGAIWPTVLLRELTAGTDRGLAIMRADHACEEADYISPHNPCQRPVLGNNGAIRFGGGASEIAIVAASDWSNPTDRDRLVVTGPDGSAWEARAKAAQAARDLGQDWEAAVVAVCRAAV